MRRAGWQKVVGAGFVLVAAGGINATTLADPGAGSMATTGENPHPVQLRRPHVATLSAMAQLGRLIFFDDGLSSSGRLSCASCHSPEHAYGPPNDAPAMQGGAQMSRQGVRAVPSLMYLDRQTNFSIGADNAENESTDLAQRAAAGAQAPRANKTAQATAEAAANLVPQGGLFWDGRADTLQDQAAGPLLNPLEMDGGSVEAVATRLRHTAYAPRFVQLFGTSVFDTPRMAVAEALFAVARYQIEDPSLHPYSSKFDAWLEGKARLSEAEMRGYLLFNDPHKANCGGCHLDRPTPDGLPPLFTDQQFEALGAPRNAALSVNDDAGYFDLGICGPYRSDMRDQTQYCGMFLTPTLRNVATRQVFFHNGVFHSLRAVLDFYNFRDVDPGRIYPRAADGSVEKLNDLPARYRANLDVADAPFDRAPGEAPPMSAGDEADLIAFLQALTDGFELRAR